MFTFKNAAKRYHEKHDYEVNRARRKDSQDKQKLYETKSDGQWAAARAAGLRLQFSGQERSEVEEGPVLQILTNTRNSGMLNTFPTSLLRI